MRVISPWFFLVFSTLGLSGCHAPPPATGPTERLVQVADSSDYVDAMLTVLRENDFRPQFVDRRAGLIETSPTTSGQWFEIWRRDVHGAYQIFESSLHTIRRRVTVSLEPVDAGGAAGGAGDYWLSVEARKERLSRPERQVTSASGALGIYSERVPTIEGVRGSSGGGRVWVPLGRDVLLENYLLGRFASLADALPATPPGTSHPAPPPVRSAPSRARATQRTMPPAGAAARPPARSDRPASPGARITAPSQRPAVVIEPVP